MLCLVALALSFAAAFSPGARAQVDFTLPGLATDTVRLSDYRGRWVVVNLWATWCPPCVEEMPELEDFHNRHQDWATVIGVNYEDKAVADLRAFVDDFFITYPVALSGARPLPGFPTVRGLPTTFIVSPQGELAATHTGVLTAALLENLVGGLRDNREMP